MLTCRWFISGSSGEPYSASCKCVVAGSPTPVLDSCGGNCVNPGGRPDAALRRRRTGGGRPYAVAAHVQRRAPG